MKDKFRSHKSFPKQKQKINIIKLRNEEHTCIRSMTSAKITFATSVRKLTLMGLKLNLPSTLDMYTKIGCKR